MNNYFVSLDVRLKIAMFLLQNESLLSPGFSPSVPIPFRNSRSSYALSSSNGLGVSAAVGGDHQKKSDSEAELQNLWSVGHLAGGRDTPGLLSPSPFHCSSPMSKSMLNRTPSDFGERPRLHHTVSVRDQRYRRDSSASSLVPWLGKIN